MSNSSDVARNAFTVGQALATGAATLGPDDDLESAKGAFLTAMSANDPEWSPRASYVLSELLLRHNDVDGAERHLSMALSSGHSEWQPAAEVVQGLICASRGDVAGAQGAYRRAIASEHPTHAPNAWFNLGTLHQQRGEVIPAIEAFRHAVASRHHEFAAKAAVNLGFVLFNQAGDIDGARAAFHEALATGHPEQSLLARMNLDALDALAESPGGWTGVDDAIDVSAPQTPPFKARYLRDLEASGAATDTAAPAPTVSAPSADRSRSPGGNDMRKAKRLGRHAFLAAAAGASIWLVIAHSLPAGYLPFFANVPLVWALVYLTFSGLRADWEAWRDARKPPSARKEEREEVKFVYGRVYGREIAEMMDHNWIDMVLREQRERIENERRLMAKFAWGVVAVALVVLAADYAWLMWPS